MDSGAHVTTNNSGSRVGVDLHEVLAGLGEPLKSIPSKYHYDERGSELFEEITCLEEYYPTRVERALLEKWMPELVKELRPASLVELGAGSSEKSRVALDAMVDNGCGRAYVPVDVSADFLTGTAAALEQEYPSLEILPLVADITEPLGLPAGLTGPTWVAILGSTLGNFEEGPACQLLQRVAALLRKEDRFLLGVDLRPGEGKSAERIELAYNDAGGVTAAFSLNLLSVLNNAFGCDFDPSAFRHRSCYNAEAGRIETSLAATSEQTIRFQAGDSVHLAEGEAIRTEISCKYDRPTIDALFARSGLMVDRWIEDSDGYYVLIFGMSTE